MRQPSSEFRTGLCHRPRPVCSGFYGLLPACCRPKLCQCGSNASTAISAAARRHIGTQKADCNVALTASAAASGGNAQLPESSAWNMPPYDWHGSILSGGFYRVYWLRGLAPALFAPRLCRSAVSFRCLQGHAATFTELNCTGQKNQAIQLELQGHEWTTTSLVNETLHDHFTPECRPFRLRCGESEMYQKQPIRELYSAWWIVHTYARSRQGLVVCCGNPRSVQRRILSLINDGPGWVS